MVDSRHEFVVVGSGAGGATLARERARRGRGVLVVARGRPEANHVERYDQLGMEHYGRTGELVLNAMTLPGRRVLDVGCGTGTVSFLASDRGAARVVGGDYRVQPAITEALIEMAG